MKNLVHKTIHIISFDIPYPPNYGGVIDVYYKIRILSEQGVKIILHVFEYPGRDRSSELEKICEKVYYYSRKTGFISMFSIKPYIVFSRRSERLVENLLKDAHPIFFEGIHTINHLNDKRLKGRKKIFRAHNIEHHYYFNLFKVERNLGRKMFYFVEACKLKLFESSLHSVNLICTVSKSDQQYFKKQFPDVEILYLPSFHRNNNVSSKVGKGDFVLYNGNLEVSENVYALEYIITKIFNDIPYKLIIAGMNPVQKLKDLASQYSNVEIIENPNDDKMFSLIREAHINLMVTFQATGLKLKLINTLYNGRYNLVNSTMLNGTGLDQLCEIADEPQEMKRKIDELFKCSFEDSDIEKREEILNGLYSNKIKVEKLVENLF